MKIGYSLSCEESSPASLITQVPKQFEIAEGFFDFDGSQVHPRLREMA